MTLREQVNQAVRKAAVGVLDKVPSPGNPDAKQGEDCGCGRRKKRVVNQLRSGVSAAQIVKNALSDIRGKEIDDSA